MSYANIIMYSSVLPSYDSKKDRANTDMNRGKAIHADDPKNRDLVHSLLFG